YQLDRPFLVIATQNPVEYEGTYPLPEAQLDRFAVKMSIGYPPLSEEARMLAEQTGEPPLDLIVPVASRAELVDAVAAARDVLVASWAFGSTPLVVVGLGLVAAGVFARLWARAADGSIDFERRLLAGERVEGDDLAIEVRARYRRHLLGGEILLRQRLGPLE